MEPHDDELIADLRALRPTPRPQFAAELDERAAAGFPRRSRLLQRGAPALFTAMRNKGPADFRRLAAAGGRVAILVIVIATGVVASNESQTHLDVAVTPTSDACSEEAEARLGQIKPSSSIPPRPTLPPAAPNRRHPVWRRWPKISTEASGSATARSNALPKSPWGRRERRRVLT
ncbi:MAG: hypothetical protein ACJ76D_09765 [Solirubrobacterales bacterium]